MSIFICWSGERSHRFAEQVHTLLSGVFPGAQPFLSSDIEKGVLWFEALTDALERSRAAVVCVTTENAASAWMHFEVGAIFSRQQHKRTFLYWLDGISTHLPGPFAHFQASAATSKEETAKMVAAVARVLNAAQESWRTRFDARWDEYAIGLEPLREPSLRRLIPRFGEYLQAKTFAEPIHECMDQGWVDRYSRAKRTRDELSEARAVVEGALTPLQKRQLDELVSELDAYVRLLRQIVRDVRFDVESAQVDFSRPQAIEPVKPMGWLRDAVEERLQSIRNVTLRLEPGLAKP